MIEIPDEFPVLSTRRLQLSLITESHIPDLHEMRSSEYAMKFLDRPIAKNLQDTEKLFRNMELDRISKKSLSWGIFEKGRDKLIGFIGFWRMDLKNLRAEIGYMIHPEFEGKGLMTEALHVALEYGFQTLKLHTIEADVNPKNEKSIGLLLKFNFVKEAHFKESYYFNGKFLDAEIYTKFSDLN